MSNISLKLPTTPDCSRPITMRSRRRANSSLERIFQEQGPLMPTLEHLDASLVLGESTRSDEELAMLTRRLRRAKRRLLLQVAENNESQTELLRELLLQLSINSSKSSGRFATCANTAESYHRKNRRNVPDNHASSR